MVKKIQSLCSVAVLAAVAIVSVKLQAATVADVRFEQTGKNPIPSEMLSLTLRLRKGMEFKREYLDQDIKNLYATGTVSDVVSEVRKLDGDKVEVIFKLRPSPVISVMKIVGNNKFSTKDLQSNFTVNEGERLNSKRLNETLENLRKFYTGKGYNDVRIAPPAVVPDGKGGVIVTVKIEENLRLKVKDVTFDGAALFTPGELRGVLFNSYSYWNVLPFINDYLNYGLLDRKELDADKARLRELYREKGYLDFKVDKVDVITSKEDPEYVNIAFKITEGKPYTVSEVSVAGNNALALKELLPRVALKSGEIFRGSAEKKTIRDIAAMYDARGYAEAVVRARHSINYPEQKVKVIFEITEGQKYRVNEIIPVGNTATKSKVLLREMAIQPGDPVSKRRIEISRQRLLGMGYFKNVKVEAVNSDDLETKDIRITVEEKPERYNIRLGAGASDVSNIFGMAEISTNNFDITNPRNWFYGGGQRMRIQGIYGIDNAGFNVDFVEPWLLDLPIRFELSGYYNVSEYDDWTEDHFGVRASLQRKVFDDFTTVKLAYKFEAVDVDEVNHKLKRYFKQNDMDGNFLVSQPSLQISRDTRDSLVDPTEGYYVSLFGSITPEVLGSSSNYYRWEVKGSYFMNFFDKAIVAMVGAKFGVVSGFDSDSDDVPVFERYFLGGSNSLRGFEYRSVGPKVNGCNVGGTTMLLLTAEVSHPIWGPLRGAAFVDVGNAWENPYEMDFSEINVGIGYGFRLKLPWVKAPLKLDLAYPIVNNQDNVSNKLRIHFNVGFTF